MAKSPPQVMTEHDIEVGTRIRAWVMGSPKVGKTCSLLLTSPSPVFIMNCDPLAQAALAGPKRLGAEFDWMPVRSEGGFNKAMRAIRDGDYATVIVDPFNMLIEKMETEYLEEVNGDGRRAYPALQRSINYMVDQLFELDAHVLVSTHWIENGVEGEGIAPLLPGKLKTSLPARFNDVLFMSAKRINGKRERVFLCSPEGAWGAGSRSIDTDVIPADVGGFIDLIAGKKPKRAKKYDRDDRDDRDDDRRDRRDDDEDSDRPRGGR